MDDTDIIHRAKEVTTSGIEVAEEMQKAIDTWEGGLRAIGGALIPSKSHWYLINHWWNEKEWKYMIKAQILAKLKVKDVSGQYGAPLERLEAREAKETLGVFLSVDGNNREQIEDLQDKTEIFAAQVRTSKTSREEAWWALELTIMKSL